MEVLSVNAFQSDMHCSVSQANNSCGHLLKLQAMFYCHIAKCVYCVNLVAYGTNAVPGPEQRVARFLLSAGLPWVAGGIMC